jgi:hypothetical protein
VQLIGLSVASTSGSQFRCSCAHAITLAVTNPACHSFSYNIRDIRVTNVVSRHCAALHWPPLTFALPLATRTCAQTFSDVSVTTAPATSSVSVVLSGIDILIGCNWCGRARSGSQEPRARALTEAVAQERKRGLLAASGCASAGHAPRAGGQRATLSIHRLRAGGSGSADVTLSATTVLLNATPTKDAVTLRCALSTDI